MTSTSRLYDAMNSFLRQYDMQWRDLRHLKTLCWMMVGITLSQNVHLNGFGVYIHSRAQLAQSHQRRFCRFLDNRRIDIPTVHQILTTQALSQWGKKRLYLSLDTTLVGIVSVLSGLGWSIGGARWSWHGVLYRKPAAPLCGVIALTMLFLVLQGTQVVAQGKRRLVDAH